MLLDSEGVENEDGEEVWGRVGVGVENAGGEAAGDMPGPPA